MDELMLAGIIAICGTLIVLFLMLMVGLYIITAMRQEQINAREHLRTQKALAKYQAEMGIAQAEAGAQGGQGMELGNLLQYLPYVQALMKGPGQQGQVPEAQQELK